ncbi:MAG: 3'(2'),5'-bisphosphate nucleotidase CysQ [Paracoccaceae bacterium]
MPATDLPLLIAAAKTAGRVATSFTGPSAQRWDKADGAGPVTEADLAVNCHLSTVLRLARPDYGWLSEETEDDTARLDHERVFIIDPIDGTRSFVEGSRTWAIAIAVVESGRVTAGVVYLPLRDKLYAASENLGATLNGAPLNVSKTRDVDGARVLAAKPNFNDNHWAGDVPAVERHYRPSLAYRLALVAEGRFDAMLTLRPSWEWDLAAGSLLISEAGGRVTDRDGACLKFNNPHPSLNGIVAGQADLQATLQGRLIPSGH